MSVGASEKVINFNVGILGHVDSGKTALAKSLSSVASTAAFDKHPQSKERGITLDLGFSSFVIPVDQEMISEKSELAVYNQVQVTLVDCPGHASLIRTVIGGAQIIDLVVLVVDATKGVQTQTAECLLLAEITCPRQMIVVINKIDLIPEHDRDASLKKLEKRLAKTLQATQFASSEIVAISACPGANSESEPLQIEKLMSVFRSKIFVPVRSSEEKFTFLVDHCFAIKGQGTVMTGTVLSGKVAVGETLEVPSLRQSKKIKSIQVFRKPVNQVFQGDRCGICFTQLEASKFERGLVCSPGAVETAFAAVASLNRIRYFKRTLKSKSRFHVTIGHETVMAKCSFFQSENNTEFSFNSEHRFLEEIGQSDSDDVSPEKTNQSTLVLLEFDQAVLCPSNCLYIASRLDANIHSNSCRLAFYGRLLGAFTSKDYVQQSLPSLRVFKQKERGGTVERMTDEYTVIVHSLFKKETNVDLFAGLKVELSTGEKGFIEGPFGQSGKAKIRIPSQLDEETVKILENVGKKKGKAKTTDTAVSQTPPVKVHLKYKRYIYDLKKKMLQ